MTKWSHLPNAKYIDRILPHIKNDPESWDAAYEAAGKAALAAAQEAAWCAAGKAAWESARDAAWEAAKDAASRASPCGAAWEAVRDAILALIAWDHAGALLALPAEQVRVLALLGQPAAILIYPAVLAMENLPKSLIINKIDLVDQ